MRRTMAHPSGLAKVISNWEHLIIVGGQHAKSRAIIVEKEAYGRSMLNKMLGKGPVKHDARTLKAEKYLQYNAPPPLRDWTGFADPSFGYMLNDKLGDCTCCAPGHLIQCWTAEQGTELTLPDSAILKAYEDVGGYRIGDPSTDNGAQLLDVLNYWRKTGIGGHKIGAYVQLNIRDIEQIKAAINLFGGVYVGAMLPKAAQSQDIWLGPKDLKGDNSPESWGGHAMASCKYDHTYIEFITWGARQKAEWGWWSAYVDECYAILSAEWVTNNLLAPNGLDITVLTQDLGLIAA